MELTKEELKARRWAKTKIRRVYKIEEDGSKTQARVVDFGSGRIVLHNEEGPALINKQQRKKEYYLNGILYDFEKWKEIKKAGEGLPWYKQSGSTVKTARF